MKRQSPSSLRNKLAPVPQGANFVDAVLDRTSELVDPGVRWQRALWNTGLVMSLQEVLEASDAVAQGALSKGAVRWLANSVHGMIAADPGAGDGSEKKAIRDLLTRDLTCGGIGYHELATWITVIERCFLKRWAQAVSEVERPSREKTARALAAHLLDLGYSHGRISGWLGSLEPSAAEEIFEGADALVGEGPKTFNVMLLFEKPPPKRIERPAEWRDSREVKDWLEQNGHTPRRQHGGLLLKLDARDAEGAAEQAADAADRLSARASVGTRDAVRLQSHALLENEQRVLVLRRARRAEVRALEREGRLLDLSRSGPIDDALELLSHLNTAPSPVAAAGGWSAVESLLSGPGDEDKAVTAERIAYLVACSWPRAELTTIGWTRQRPPFEDDLARRLGACASNRQRSQLMLDEIVADKDLGLETTRDRLAISRIEKLHRAPRARLEAAQRRAEASLRRLYRQRNLVVHGGQIHGIALPAALRTAAPLVGAGIDRLTHAYLTRGMDPLALAAQARMEVERSGSAGAPPLTAMLE